MADKKISQLTAATTPLAGTEVLPIVQNNATVKVPVNNLFENASSTKTGVLSSTDWTTFNNKAPTTSPSFSNSISVLSPSTTSTTVATFSATTNGTGGITYVQIGTEYADGSSRIGSVNVTGNISKLVFETMRVASGSFTEDFNCSSGNITIPSGNLIIGESGKGIDFSATPGTGTSELLADYEEGTFTPAISFGGGTTGITYSVQTGSYTKIGNRVFVTGFIILTSKGTSTGIVRISTPYSVANNNNARGGISLGYVSGITYVGQMYMESVPNVSEFRMGYFTEGGAQADITNAEFTNNTILGFSGQYYTT